MYYRISRGLLNFPYILSPIAVLIALLDTLFMKSYLKDTLPYSFHSVVILRYILSQPHIVASTLSLFDQEYLNHFKGKLFLPIAFLFSGIFYPWSPIGLKGIFLVLDFMTAIHFMSQQFKISGMITGLCKKDLKSWLISGFIFSALIHLLLTLAKMLDDGPLVHHLIYSLDLLFLISTIPFVIVGVRIRRRTQTKEGKNYLLGTVIMGICVQVSYFMGYPFFVFLISQFVHDFTAFAFYMVHDGNRNYKNTNNVMYWLMSWSPLGPFWLNPILSVGLTVLLFDLVETGRIPMLFFAFLGFLHYYIESFIWRSDSPLRKEVVIA